MPDLFYQRFATVTTIASSMAGDVGGVVLSATAGASIENSSSTSALDNTMKVLNPAAPIIMRGADVALTPIAMAPQDGLTLICRVLCPTKMLNFFIGFGKADDPTDLFGCASVLRVQGYDTGVGAVNHENFYLSHQRGGSTNVTIVELMDAIGKAFGGDEYLDVYSTASHLFNHRNAWEFKGVLAANGGNWDAHWFCRHALIDGEKDLRDWFPLAVDRNFSLAGQQVDFRFGVRQLPSGDTANSITVDWMKAGTGVSIDGEPYGLDADNRYRWVCGPRVSTDSFVVMPSLEILPSGKRVALICRGAAEATVDIDVDVFTRDRGDLDYTPHAANPIFPQSGSAYGYHDGGTMHKGNIVHAYTTKWETAPSGNRYPVVRVSSDGGVTWGSEISLQTIMPPGVNYTVLSRPGNIHSNGTWIIFTHDDSLNLYAITTQVDVPTSVSDFTVQETGLVGCVEATWVELSNGSIEVYGRDQLGHQYVQRITATIAANGTITWPGAIEEMDGAGGRQLLDDGADPSHFIRVGANYFRIHARTSGLSRGIYDISYRRGDTGAWRPVREAARLRSNIIGPVLAVDRKELVALIGCGKTTVVEKRWPLTDLTRLPAPSRLLIGESLVE